MNENPQTIEVSVAMEFRFTLNDKGTYDLTYVKAGVGGLFSDAEEGIWNEDMGDWQHIETAEQDDAFWRAKKLAKSMATAAVIATEMRKP